MTAQCARLPGNRWHFGHGPIDLVIGADGEPGAVQAAHAAAWQRFVQILPELVAELSLLREPVQDRCPLHGVVARRMWAACHPFRSVFITPMAAVAGAVAEEIIRVYERPGVTRAWVNNGGDIALHLAPGESVQVGLFVNVHGGEDGIERGGERGIENGVENRAGNGIAHLAGCAESAGTIALDGRFTVEWSMPVRGIATSGWRGRSFSLGIADAVTVLAPTAAQADAAATIIGNAVDVADSRIVRRPADELKDDTDLRDLPVTVDVPELEMPAVWAALAGGLRRARDLQGLGLVCAAALSCQGWLVTSDNDRPRRLTGDSASGARSRHAVADMAATR